MGEDGFSYISVVWNIKIYHVQLKLVLLVNNFVDYKNVHSALSYNIKTFWRVVQI